MDEDADVISIVSHKRSSTGKTVVWSITQDVISKNDCPVLARIGVEETIDAN